MDEKWKDYFYKGAAVFLTVAMCILFFFVVFRFDDLRKYIGSSDQDPDAVYLRRGNCLSAITGVYLV